MPATPRTATDALAIDCEREVARICDALRTQVGETLRRRGVVLGMSGGVDSSVCAALAVRALGTDRVLGLLMPERESSPESVTLARSLADDLGIAYEVEDVTAALEGAGCYRRRDDAIRKLVPRYGPGWACKLVLPGDRLEGDAVNVFHLVVQSPWGEQGSFRLGAAEYRAIVAATSFKQRVRKMVEYYHADRMHYAVLGTPNRLEFDQGFFVKGGDGLADVKPIAHLYKSQVYQLAEHLGLPYEITNRPPTTDTYSLPQTQEEFFFSMSTAMLDEVLWARSGGRSVSEAAECLDLPEATVARAFREVDRKRAATRYLHVAPLLVEPVLHPTR